MNNSYKIYKTDFEGKPSRRYWKLVYTVALRLGMALEEDDIIKFDFEGKEYPTPEKEAIKHDQSNERFRGTLLLNNTKFDGIIFVHTTKFSSSRPRFVTLWPETEDERAAEGTVEPLIKLALEGEAIPASEVVTEMHPEYVKNPGIDPIVLLARAKTIAEKDASSLLRWAEIWKDKATANEERVRILEEENKSLDEEVKRLLRENERLKAEAATAGAKGDILVQNQAKKLISVEENVLVGRHLNTVLNFEDGTRKTIKISTFDRDLSVTNKAKTLVNRMVKTTCWDPKNEPGKYSNLGYFRNVYESE